MATQRERAVLTSDTAAAVTRFNDAVNAHDIDAVMDAMTDDCIFDSTRPPPDGEIIQGQTEVRRFWEEFFRRSPEARFETEEIFIAGNRCVVRWVYHWVRDGRPGRVRGVDLFRVANGKIAEKLSYVKG
jgi:ketosteroid isomerase-like protein